jgi:hypothetical protein
VKPGYLTDFSTFIACSSKIDMHKTYPRLVGRKPRRYRCRKELR